MAKVLPVMAFWISVLYPMKEISSKALGCTVMEKLPLISVIAPFSVPASLIVAPITGSPFTSVTFPFTILSCCCTSWVEIASSVDRIIFLSSTV